MKSLTLAFLMILPPLSFAEGRALTISDYFRADVRPGDVVCEVVQLEPGQTRCYLTTGFKMSLSENNDPSGVLNQGAINPNQ